MNAMNTDDARLLWIRFEYTVAADTAEPDIAPDTITYLNELNDEHVYATGQDITRMTTADLGDWYGGTAAKVHAVLGY